MEGFEVIAMVVALLLMGGAAVAKMVTAYLINRMKHSIAMVDRTQQSVLGKLKKAQSQRKVAEKNKTILTQKKTKIQKQISRLTQKLKEMEKEEARRQKTRETMRGTVTE